MTEKQQKFVEEYLIDLNAGRAAARAGYDTQNYRRIMKSPEVKKEIDKAMAGRTKRTEINPDDVIGELARIAFRDTEDMAYGHLSDDVASALADADEKAVRKQGKAGGARGERDTKLSYKMKALELLGKHFGMFNDRNDSNADRNVVVIFGEEKLED